ncbi:hypothetical protein EPUS_00992 [Endocarpon pusillum Z07020]|uniref:Uncharacterized protein n=1 Tax=Endocarpon pusillum (strain Z07020 / HMAS-L-300199) TaxID=1263415 RepID=U1GN86_ENDPU|nr:uncharacterized protein EPUS_00992 [Endocarpon pusillum Z07020]ERF73738.1 hypothetical protein EPUS_00992 [Endocarpon pusillum Z07020]
MSEKLESGVDHRAPPYEASSTPPPAFSESKNLSQPSLHFQLTTARSGRILDLIKWQIEPLLYAELLEGATKRVFVVIPANVLAKQPDLAAKDIVSSQDVEIITLIRLDGPENKSAFWLQPGVIQELPSRLRERLAASGHKVEPAPMEPIEPPQGTSTRDVQSQRQASPSWLIRQFGTPGPQHDPTATTNYRLGWRSEKENLPQRALALDEVRVLATARPISFRVETEMGLLDSFTGTVLWLEIEVGT